MAQGAFGVSPFSADVRLWFDCSYGRIPLAQAGPAVMVLAQAQRLPACTGTLVVSIDGQEHARQVQLVGDLSEQQPSGLIADVAADPPF